MLLSELNAKDIGHLGLDIIGLAPGVGEIADGANVAWYLKDGQYLLAALSLISMVPAVGDAVGKGIKIVINNTKLLDRFLVKYGDDVIKHWQTARTMAEKSRKLKPYARKMDAAIRDLRHKRRNQLG